VLSGCFEQSIDATYGRRGGLAAQSVNGTAVLGELFTQAGFKVESRTVLSPDVMKNVDTIVWFPDEFAPPDEMTIGWFERWLRAGPNRTLVYVGRDFDAERNYWLIAGPLAPKDQQNEFGRKRTAAGLRFRQERAAIPADAHCEWFRLDTKPEERQAKALAGPWSNGVAAKQTRIELFSRLVPDITAESGGDVEPLLTWGDEVLAARLTNLQWWEGSGQVILVSNGSFLLNLPLVEHEHRKLAARLVAEADTTGEPGRCVFLESGPGPVRILERDPGPRLQTPLDLLKIWPWSYVLLHLAVLGIIFSFARWPIFGTPRGLPDPGLSDFGKHVTALGELLATTADRNFAKARLTQYRLGKDE
jgi:hypothetical protein